MKKITIQDIKDFKHNSSCFATLTAYDYTSAQLLDESEIPLILVGDSASMTIYGYNTTIPITMEEMMLVTRAVTRGAKNSLVVADMPFLSYQTSIESAIKNAGLFIKKGGASAVKIEGGRNVLSHIKALVGFGIPVLGHVGLTPQSYYQLSGYSIQGKTPHEAQKIIDDAKAVEDGGAFGVVLECIPEKLAQLITESLSIPTIGIGSGGHCDGQIQVFHDIMGLSKKKPPKHAKQYDSMYSNMLKVVKKYKSDIESS